MLHLFDLMRELTPWAVPFKLVLAILCGGMVGLERGSKRRPAGFRTYMLVSMGSALVMMTNQYITMLFSEPTDPARLGAQVISGIGFLGAGTIIVTRNNHVIGLTTAAGLWASACVGLAIGIGFFEGALIACCAIFFIISAMHHIEQFIAARSRALEIYVELRADGKMSGFLNSARSERIAVQNIELVKPQYHDGTQTAALISLRLPRRQDHRAVVEFFSRLPDIDYIEEVGASKPYFTPAPLEP
jgi:putative Mg2+ transporter-C (MgtC) family protein